LPSFECLVDPGNKLLCTDYAAVCEVSGPVWKSIYRNKQALPIYNFMDPKNPWFHKNLLFNKETTSPWFSPNNTITHPSRMSSRGLSMIIQK
jgi:hypothetical protein